MRRYIWAGLISFVILSAVLATARGGVISSGFANKVSVEKEVLSTQINRPGTQETRIETKNQEIPFASVRTNSDQYTVGTQRVVTDGKIGLRKITYQVNYVDGAEVGRAEVKNEIIAEPVSEVIAIGTRAQPTMNIGGSSHACDPNYDPCVRFSSSDLDCDDIKMRVTVLSYDPHRLDHDHDGIGCESYN